MAPCNRRSLEGMNVENSIALKYFSSLSNKERENSTTSRPASNILYLPDLSTPNLSCQQKSSDSFEQFNMKERSKVQGLKFDSNYAILDNEDSFVLGCPKSNLKGQNLQKKCDLQVLSSHCIDSKHRIVVAEEEGELKLSNNYIWETPKSAISANRINFLEILRKRPRYSRENRWQVQDFITPTRTGKQHTNIPYLPDL